MKRFGLIGAAGYIAPRHMKAIYDTGNKLVAALDKNDSVGIIDSYFPNSAFFTEIERFDRHIDKLRRNGNGIDYMSICSPNYLHDAHCRLGLRNGANIICEKPLVLNPWNIDALENIEKETGNSIYNILQLRLHDSIQKLKTKYVNISNQTEKIEIDLTYITTRGNWYYASWKGENNKSGGIATNIGIHFFDILIWIFGNVEHNIVHRRNHDRASGYLELKHAKIRWFLSISKNTLPNTSDYSRTFRKLTIGNREFDFSKGFENLHTSSYITILEGNGYTTKDVRPSIELVHEIRNKEISPLKGEYHPLNNLPLDKHPFE